VLAKYHKMCKLANWSRPSNITSCARAPGGAAEEQAKQPNKHINTCGENQAPNFPMGAPGRKRLIFAQCCRSLWSLSFSGKVTLLACTFYDGLVAVQGIRIIILNNTMVFHTGAKESDYPDDPITTSMEEPPPPSPAEVEEAENGEDACVGRLTFVSCATGDAPASPGHLAAEEEETIATHTPRSCSAIELHSK
jgi:hypothetical protein